MSARRVLPEGALPVREGQVWSDRDKRMALKRVTVEEVKWGTGPGGLRVGERVFYTRHGIRTSSRLERFIAAFDFVSNPESGT